MKTAIVLLPDSASGAEVPGGALGEEVAGGTEQTGTGENGGERRSRGRRALWSIHFLWKTLELSIKSETLKLGPCGSG